MPSYEIATQHKPEIYTPFFVTKPVFSCMNTIIEHKKDISDERVGFVYIFCLFVISTT